MKSPALFARRFGTASMYMAGRMTLLGVLDAHLGAPLDDKKTTSGDVRLGGDDRFADPSRHRHRLCRLGGGGSGPGLCDVARLSRHWPVYPDDARLPPEAPVGARGRAA
jgi:hypothetical protein